VGERFSTTQWSRVRTARDGSDSDARRALEELCQTYWYPLYAFVRRQGYDAAAAEDLTQAYFAELVEKDFLKSVESSAGRFRSFLIASVRHFLSNQRERDQALKRGGGARTISLETANAEALFKDEPAECLDPEQVFERRWALIVIGRAMERLQHAAHKAGTEAQLECLRPYLTGEATRAPYSEVAAELGMTVGAVKGAVHRLRKRFGQLLRAEIAETVSDPAEVDDEIRHLLTVIEPLNHGQS